MAEAGSAFEVHLRGTGTFRPVSPVVFVSLVQGISQTEQLAAAVRSGPLDVDVEFPFHPHVTVAHHLTDEQMDRAFDELAEFDCVVRGDRASTSTCTTPSPAGARPATSPSGRGADPRDSVPVTQWPLRIAVRRSRLSWEITSRGISLGQAAAHSPMLVQPPKPS